jgi:hypothetical protein
MTLAVLVASGVAFAEVISCAGGGICGGTIEADTLTGTK